MDGEETLISPFLSFRCLTKKLAWWTVWPITSQLAASTNVSALFFIGSCLLMYAGTFDITQIFRQFTHCRANLGGQRCRNYNCALNHPAPEALLPAPRLSLLSNIENSLLQVRSGEACCTVQGGD